MGLKAEKDKLIGLTIESQIYGSYSKDEHKSIAMEVGIIDKQILYIVYVNNKEVLRVSDLDIAIDKFNEY